MAPSHNKQYAKVSRDNDIEDEDDHRDPALLHIERTLPKQGKEASASQSKVCSAQGSGCGFRGFQTHHPTLTL